MRRHSLLIVGAALLLAALLSPPAPARAHAIILRTEPADGALISATPRRIQLWFSQAVGIDARDVTISAASSGPIAPLEVSAQPYQPQLTDLAGQFDQNYLYLCSVGRSLLPSLVTIELPQLAPDTYRVSWRAIALDDRFATSGTAVFAVGGGAPAAIPNAPSGLAHADDLVVTLDVKPNRPGRTFILIGVHDTRRPAPAPVEAVDVTLHDANGTATTLRAEAIDGGRFQVGGDALNTAGEWTIGVAVHRPALPDALASIRWTMPAPESSAPSWGWLLLALLVIGVGAGIGAILVMFSIARNDAKAQTWL